MYNFRYHLVTIVSIFAALALGLLLGVAITGSDLVRTASDNLAESLTDQFDELNATNESLSEQLQAQQSFANGLLSGWQKNRLEGRTIVILTRASGSSDSLTDELSALITRCGGVPVVVRIDPSKGFGLDDAATLSALKQLLPEVEDEAYEVTLARALVDEWSFTTSQDAILAPMMFETAYPLTNLLVERKRITVTTAYQPLLEAFGAAGLPPADTVGTEGTGGAAGAVGTEGTAGTGGAEGTADTEGAEGELGGEAASDFADLATELLSEALALAQQRTAYELAESSQLPYGANGVIDTAVFSASAGGKATADPVAAQIALAFDRKGLAGDLPYLRLASQTGAVTWPNPSQVVQETSDASYYALLVQQGDSAEAMLELSQETGLPCELSPFEPMGSYGVIALLTGAERGTYGLGRSDTTVFPPIPSQ